MIYEDPEGQSIPIIHVRVEIVNQKAFEPPYPYAPPEIWRSELSRNQGYEDKELIGIKDKI